MINVDDHEPNFVIETHQQANNEHQHHSFADNIVNNIREAANGPNQNNNNNNDNSDGNSSVAISVETRATHKNLENYITFLGILLTKCES